MYDLTALQLLLVVNLYLLLALLVFGLSAKALVCRLRNGGRCAQRHRALKSLIAIPLMLSCLALLVVGLFALGMSHGSRPEGYQVALFIGGCLLPILLLVLWVVGSAWLDGFWAALVLLALGYLLLLKPALYVEYWAGSNVSWAQMWMARHASSGEGGLRQSESTARRWYQRAAEEGDAQAQLLLGDRARRRSEARRWYLMAAERGHAGAMVQLARLSPSDDERQRWLQQALAQRHPDALFMVAEQQSQRDLPRARQLLLEAAELGSRGAMVRLIDEYGQGGVLFGRDADAATKWLARLEATPASSTDPAWGSPTLSRQRLALGQQGAAPDVDDAVTLYAQARRFLNHPAKDPVLHQRAVDHLVRAARQGHPEAALELARLAASDGTSKPLSDEALRWYRRSAELGNRQALIKLVTDYKERPGAGQAELQQSLDYNQRLLALLADDPGTRSRLSRQHWSGEYRDTEKRLAQLQRLGGSWQSAIDRAQADPQQEYRLARELIDSGQFAAGMERLHSAARRDDPQARFELSRRTLRGPRSFSQEIAAVSELQRLDQQGHLAASLRLGSMYQSGTGILPRNYYLARQLFRKGLVDPALAESAQRWLDRTPDITDTLVISDADDPQRQLTDWYLEAMDRVPDPALLQRQYDVLRDHFRDTGPLAQAVENLGEAQYQRAQTLQSHDLEDAVAWLQRAAKNGHSGAQYELAVRMIRGKRNSTAEVRQLQHWARSAADAGHVGAMVFLASQHARGAGGLIQSDTDARAYYRQALNSSDAEVLYRGRIAGRSIRIERAALEKGLVRLRGGER